MTDIMDLPHSEDESLRTDSRPEGESDGLDARLKPVLQELDEARLTQRGEFFFRTAVAVLSAGALAMVSGLSLIGVLGAGLKDLNIVVYVLPPLVAATILGAWACLPYRQYSRDYKTDLLPAIAAALGDFRFDTTGKIAIERLAGSTLLPTHEAYHSEDMFFGHYKGTEIALAEVKLSRAQGVGEDRKTKVAFKGLFVLLSLQRSISGKAVVRLNAGSAKTWLGGTFGGLVQFVPEDPAFDRRFEAYATDKAEAVTLLTPALLAGLSRFADHMGGGALRAAFYENQLFVMVDNDKNLFEAPTLLTSVQKQMGTTRITREFRDILVIADSLVQRPA